MNGKDVRVKVLYWAQAREAAGVSSEMMLVRPPADLPTLMEQILELHPKLAGLKQSIKLAINGEICGKETKLNDGDEVALLPPVAGG